jgi:hypothetical protein
MAHVSDLERRGSHTPRRKREQRAYTLTMVGGTAGLIGVVGFVLAIFGVIGFGLPILALIVSAVCALLFRRAISR